MSARRTPGVFFELQDNAAIGGEEWVKVPGVSFDVSPTTRRRKGDYRHGLCYAFVAVASGPRGSDESEDPARSPILR
jgi:hypothetical protein